MKKSLLLAAACAAAVSVLAHAGDLPYRVVDRIALGAPTKWDYAALDSAQPRLFVTRGDHVEVLDLPSGKIVGTIADTAGVHGVALAPELHRGFTSNGKSNSVSMFDLDTLAPLASIAVSGRNPDAILYDAALARVYVFNGASHDVDVIDARTAKPITRIAVNGRPEFAVADGHGRIYLNIEDKGELAVIDTAKSAVTATWKLAGCSEPTGLALDAARGRLFSSCANGIMAVTDAASGRQVAQFPIGEHPDAVIYDADTHTVLSSGGAGTLTVTRQDDADHYTHVTDLATARGAKTMAMDPVDKTVYLPTGSGAVFEVVVAARR